ncbi:hypothetical protein LTR02_003508 [Friedmanniomyces endolithicus]|nr:hypothetical protein LTR94_001106 [Friedmanniomyces endolithicus]KAK0813290.1 hypothetical protein LTR38_003086 [Friedmanniomyces endolithicus]KAK0815976.1 hypothetical protein LTR59_000349 [Friedmanniomyces endolithicus]KAK0818109.1 hypothetical protein LTR75_002827 [Friedmanniomyces endolithicus]KAK0869201.1 hypothetical protein LTS02_003208 [Friedmanniomyces endolithicus]
MTMLKHGLTHRSHFTDAQTQGTPLAPSVEKAYYRKCIELKRRLNEVEAANDEAKIKRVRLDRAIMKMRLERAFLLEQLSKRMNVNVDGSEGSADEGPAADPPPERPHRDKRRRPDRPLAPHHHPSNSHSHQQQPHLQPSPAQGMQAYPLASLQRLPLNAAPKYMVPGPNGEMMAANAVSPEGHLLWLPPAQLAAIPPQHSIPLVPVPSTSGFGPPRHSSQYGAPLGIPGDTAPHTQPNGHHGFDGAADERDHAQANVNRSEPTTGILDSAGPSIREDSNGERRIAADETGIGRDTRNEREAVRAPVGSGFNAINH